MIITRVCAFAIGVSFFGACPPAIADDVPVGETDLTRALPQTEKESRELGVGRLLPDRGVTLVDGSATTLRALAGERATVVVMRSADCPLCRKYGPRLAELESAYADKGVKFVYVNPMTVDDADAMRDDAERFKLTGAYIDDAESELAAWLGARATTEAFVLDQHATVRYRGAVDDQIGLGFVLPEARNAFLADALDAVLAGGSVATRATIAPGCALDTDAPVSMVTEVTYHNTVGRILNTSCVSCHREGGVGPFALDAYGQVAGRAPMVDYMVKTGAMPPWDAAAHTGPWKNDFSLTDAERDAVLAWIEAGAPEGDPADGVPAPTFPETEWTIGEPDAIFEIHTPVDVPASGAIDYVYQWVETGINRDRYVQAVEVVTEAPGVLHHALIFVEAPRREGESDRRYFRRTNWGADGYFAGYIPGQGATVFPEGYGMRLPRRSWLKFQLHYTPNGERVTDTVRVGFKFTESTPENKVSITGISNEDFVIPPDTDGIEVTAQGRVPRDMMLAGFSPHMHFRGKSFTYELITPEGERTTLLEVPDYDYNWQTLYELAEPLDVKKGSKIVCTAVFDNTDNNPRNPDPSQEVRFGEQTWDEMMIGYYMWWPQRKAIDPVGGAPASDIIGGE